MSSQFYIFAILLGLFFNSPLTHAQNKNSSEVTMQQHHHASAPNTLLRPINPTYATIPNVSQAIIVEQGQPMYLSGHVPITENGDILQAGLEQQLLLVFQNIEKTLHQANVSTQQLVKLTIYVRNLQPDQLATIRKVRDQFIQAELPPASSLIGVAQLFHPDVLVEVEAIAVIPPNKNSTF